MADKKKSAKKPSKALDKKSMKKAKGGLNFTAPSERYAGKYAAPSDPSAPIDGGSINFGL
ncbi:MAG TPA: hypothetical protein VF950_25535 [Planctomycetota bacterium]